MKVQGVRKKQDSDNFSQGFNLRFAYQGQGFIDEQFSQFSRMMNSVSTNKVIKKIDQIIELTPNMTKKIIDLRQNKDHISSCYGRNKNVMDREKYIQLVRWHQACLLDLRTKTQNFQITTFQCIKKQHQLILASLQVFCQYLLTQCQEKGLFTQIVASQQVNLFDGLLQYMDQKLKNDLASKIEAEEKLQQDYSEEIEKLKKELESLHYEKDRKWKNLFMLIKDNRILRRTKGKLIRQLQAANFKVQSLKQNILELTKENQRYKLLSQSNQYLEGGLQKWLKNMSSLMKIERYIEKYPYKAKRVLDFQLQSLEISEMETLPQKIQYIIKAIEEAQQLVDYYEDLNDLIAPSKLLLNSYTQTDVQFEEIGVNTNSYKVTNNYCQTRPSLLLDNRCRFRSNVISYFHVTQTSKNDQYLKRKASNLTISSRVEKTMRNVSQSNHKNTHRALKIEEKICLTVKPVYQTHEQYLKLKSNLFYIDSKIQTKCMICQNVVNLTIKSTSKYQLTSVDIQLMKKIERSPKKRFTQEYESNKIQRGDRLSHKLNDQNFQKSRAYLQKRFSQNNTLLNSLTKRISKIEDLSIVSQDDNVERSGEQLGAQIDGNIATKAKIQQKQSQCLNISGKKQIQEDVISQQVSYTESQGEEKQNKKKEKDDQKEKRNMSLNANSTSNTSLVKIKQKIQNLTRFSSIVSNQHLSNSKSKGEKNLKKSVNTNAKLKQQKNGKAQLRNQSQTNRSNIGNKENNFNKRFSNVNQLNKKLPNDSRSSNRSKIQQSMTLPINSSWQEQSHFDQNFQEKSDDSSCKNHQTIKQTLLTTINQIDNSCKRYQNDRRISQNFAINGLRERKKTNTYLQRISSNANLSYTSRDSYMVPPIVEEECYEQNLSGSDKKLNIEQNKNRQAINEKIDRYLQSQIETSYIDITRTLPKLLRLMYTNRAQLKNSNKSLKQFIQSTLKNKYGLKKQNVIQSFAKGLSMSLSGQNAFYANGYNQSFIQMLNERAPKSYQVDILRIYLMLMEKAGNDTLVVESQRALWIIKNMIQIFYPPSLSEKVFKQKKNKLIVFYSSNGKFMNKSKNGSLTAKHNLQYSSMVQYMNYLSNQQSIQKLTPNHINLNNFFLMLESDLYQFCLCTQFYEFCVEILPSNEIDLSYHQMHEISKFLPSTIRHQLHLSNLKLYFEKDKGEKTLHEGSRNKNRIKKISNSQMKMKIHKISLYCYRQQWKQMKNIKNEIEKQFFQLMQSNLCRQEILELFSKLDNSQFGEIYVKKQCNWLYKLAKFQLKRYYEYNQCISKHLFMLVWVVEYNLRTESMNLLGQSISFINEKINVVMKKKNRQYITQGSLNMGRNIEILCRTENSKQKERQKQKQKQRQKELHKSSVMNSIANQIVFREQRDFVVEILDCQRLSELKTQPAPDQYTKLSKSRSKKDEPVSQFESLGTLCINIRSQKATQKEIKQMELFQQCPIQSESQRTNNIRGVDYLGINRK